MNEKQDRPNQDRESEIWNAIQAFEQILAAMPGDRTALETLASAYERIGDTAQALHYLARLARAVAAERVVEEAVPLLERIKAWPEAGDDETAEARRALEQLIADDAGKTAVVPPPQDSLRRRLDITNELSLAWELLQAEEISQDEYTAMVHDLSESSVQNLQTPATVLHILEDRRFKGLPRLIAFLSRKSGLPFIALDRFDVTGEAAGLLPLSFMVRYAAMVFDVMGRTALVAVLNPFDTDLRQEVEGILERPCHFFLTSAAAYDAALEKLRSEKQEEAAKPAKPSG